MGFYMLNARLSGYRLFALFFTLFACCEVIRVLAEVELIKSGAEKITKIGAEEETTTTKVEETTTANFASWLMEIAS